MPAWLDGVARQHHAGARPRCAPNRRARSASRRRTPPAPLASTAAKPVEPRSRGTAGTPKLRQRLAHRRCVAPAGSRVARMSRERLSSNAALKAPAPVRAPGRQVTEAARAARSAPGPAAAPSPASSPALMPPPCAGGIGHDARRHRALVKSVGAVEADLRPGSRPAAGFLTTVPAGCGLAGLIQEFRRQRRHPAAARFCAGRQPRRQRLAETGKPVAAKASPGATTAARAARHKACAWS